MMLGHLLGCLGVVAEVLLGGCFTVHDDCQGVSCQWLLEYSQ